jgi:hypothetical protein
MEVANTPAYYDTAKFTDVKRFIVQAPGGSQKGSYVWLEELDPQTQKYK